MARAKKRAAPPLKGAPAPGSFAWLKGLILMALLLGFTWQVVAIAKLKTHQRVRIVPMAPLVPQGDGDGKASAVAAIEAGPDGRVYVMSLWPKGVQLQRFSSGMVFERSRWISPPEKGKKPPELVEPTTLAVGPDNKIFVAQKDGRITVLDTDFKRLGELKLDMTELEDLEVLDNGDLLVLDKLARRLRVHHPDGRLVSEFGAKKLVGPRRLALSSSGLVVVLDELGSRYVLRVFGLDQKLARTIPVHNVSPSPPNRIGAGGQDVIALNDAHGVRGMLFFDAARGVFYGESLGGSSGEPLINPGFVSGDRRLGDFYLHFGPGLQKARLPLE